MQSVRSSGKRGLSLHALLLSKTDSVAVQGMRYAVVGLIATVVDMQVLYLLDYRLDVHYLAAAAAGFAVGVVVNYLLSIRWVFASRRLANTAAEFTAFALIGVIGLGLTELILYLCHGLAGLEVMLAKAVAVVIVFAWNFGARRMLLFGG